MHLHVLVLLHPPPCGCFMQHTCCSLQTCSFRLPVRWSMYRWFWSRACAAAPEPPKPQRCESVDARTALGARKVGIELLKEVRDQVILRRNFSGLFGPRPAPPLGADMQSLRRCRCSALAPACWLLDAAVDLLAPAHLAGALQVHGLAVVLGLGAVVQVGDTQEILHRQLPAALHPGGLGGRALGCFLACCEALLEGTFFALAVRLLLSRGAAVVRSLERCALLGDCCLLFTGLELRNAALQGDDLVALLLILRAQSEVLRAELRHDQCQRGHHVILDKLGRGCGEGHLCK
mmetsp:Transcript_76056/g.122858  ORF Transcript_76056/g.122858 Transcript_76056/m.122858 type:complete len:291 (-) Transcript_76056:88-960(-)